MRRRKLSEFLKNDFHFIWIILFFIIHGYNQQKQAIQFTELLLLFLILTAISALIFYLSFIFLKSFKKAGVFVSLVLILVLFFGVYQDAIGTIRSIAYFSRLPVTLTIMLAVIIVMFIWMKYTKRRFYRTTIFINSLLLIYLFVEVSILLLSKPADLRQTYNGEKLNSCDTCSKPDV